MRLRIGVCVRMRLTIPSMVSECGPWRGDRGMQPEAGWLRTVSRTRLPRSRGGRAAPHPGDQLEPPPAGRPEPPIALAPHPAVPCLTARPHAPASGSSRGAVEVQVRFVLGTSVIVVVVVILRREEPDAAHVRPEARQRHLRKMLTIIVINIAL